ncbi:MAG TPA: xylose isomerase [Candidatus Goldiibacteriota bacterium]|nr:xylose isomerase [Candidatus Goldiibacteriota bacterium]
MEKSYHSICAWTFNAGKGGFTPGDMRPDWSGDVFGTVDVVKLVKKEIAPRLPKNIVLGLEAHFDYEYNEESAGEIASALVDSGMYLAMATPGAHRHFAYGGICSMDPQEREKAAGYGKTALEIAYGPLKKAWCPSKAPTFVLWNGSFGYDLATVGIMDMYNNLKENVAALCKYEAKLGGKMYMAIEPKPNEGHPAMLLPTVASAIVFWKKLAEEYGVKIDKMGVNKEFGHSEMIGLDLVYDTVEEIDNNMLVHMHINSQGYNDGILMGGPGKYDIDNGARINGMNIAVAGLIQKAKYSRWKGHDMQARAYDNEAQGIDRVVRSILSWEACEAAARELDYKLLNKLLVNRETAKAEDMMRSAVVYAQKWFDKNYK